MSRRAKAFSMGGGVLSSLPWIRYIAPEASGYNLLMTLNNEFKSFFMVRHRNYISHYMGIFALQIRDIYFPLYLSTKRVFENLFEVRQNHSDKNLKFDKI